MKLLTGGAASCRPFRPKSVIDGRLTKYFINYSFDVNDQANLQPQLIPLARTHPKMHAANRRKSRWLHAYTVLFAGELFDVVLKRLHFCLRKINLETKAKVDGIIR